MCRDVHLQKDLLCGIFTFVVNSKCGTRLNQSSKVTTSSVQMPLHLPVVTKASANRFEVCHLNFWVIRSFNFQQLSLPDMEVEQCPAQLDCKYVVYK